MRVERLVGVLMEIGEVGQLWRYPFKSMAGSSVSKVTVMPAGIVGDRCWAIRDEVLGGIRGAKKFSALMQCHAELVREPDDDSGEVAISLPDGTVTSTGDERCARVLSSFLRHEVTVWPLQPEENLDHYRNGRPTEADPMVEARATFALQEDEPLPNFRRLPGELRRQIREFASLPGTYFDAFPISLMTTSTLRALRDLRPDAVVDVRRFRPNIVVETPTTMDGPVEHGWEGWTLHVGAVELKLTFRSPRCAMITHGFDDVPADRSIMRTVVREFGHDLGIYAEVTRPGTIRVGDAVTAEPNLGDQE